MKKQMPFVTLGAGIAMLILILDSKTALESARAGMELLIATVIPSLFPFFFLSILFTTSADPGSLPLLRTFGKLCHLPKEADGIWIPAFLGGYPSGAQAVCQLWKQNRIPRDTAEHLLAFCNNAGPSFLFGILSSLFPKPWMVWSLWGIHIAGAIYAANWIPCCFSGSPAKADSLSLSQVLTTAVSVMASVCGWLLLFRIVIGFLSRWVLWYFPVPMQALTAGILELTNGCCMLSQVGDIRIRFVLCSGMLAMGGLCVTLQTMSVTKGLSLKYYVLGKLHQTTFSLCVSTAMICKNVLFLLPIAGIVPFLLWRQKKAVAFPVSMVYNIGN